MVMKEVPGTEFEERVDLLLLAMGFLGPERYMLAQLGVEVTEMVHVGDRDHNDVRGPQALGMKAVLFTAVRDADKDGTSADAVCDSHAGLPGAIDALAG